MLVWIEQASFCYTQALEPMGRDADSMKYNVWTF